MGNLFPASLPSRPFASVVLVTYRSRDTIVPCLRHLLQDGSGSEILVVDNASGDGTAELVEELFPSVTVLRSAFNGGFGVASNLGAAAARGEYLVFLNPDTEVAPGWLAPLIDALEADRRVAMVTPKILLLEDRSCINTCGNDVHASGLTLCRGAGLQGDCLSEAAEVGAVSGAAFAMRRDLFQSLGGFDASFFLYMEDTDLSWRARLAGYRCECIPSSLVYHDYSLRFGPLKTFYQERNRYQLLLKTLQWRTLLLLAPALLLAEVVTWGFVLLRERRHLGNKPRAYRWIAANWGAVMSRRKAVQSTRKIGDRELLRSCTNRLAYEQTGEGALARLAHLFLDPIFAATTLLVRSAAVR